MTPMYLKLENFFSHKESEIDFSLFNSALLLGSTDGDYFRSNGSGKSAIMESILWCLYNKSRASMMDDVIHWGENRCSVVFDFLHDKKTYRVKRTRMRNTSTSTVDFFIQNADSTWSPLSGSTSGETNEKIISTIKLDYKTFINSAYFRQNDISEFSTSEASKKKEILKSIVDISKWDGYEKEAKKKHKDIQLEVLQLQTKITSLTEETSSFQESVDSLSKIEHDFSLLSSQKESLDLKIDTLSDEYIKLKSSINTDGWDKSVTAIAGLKQSGKEYKLKYDSILAVLEKKHDGRKIIQSSISSLEKKLSTLSFDEAAKDKLQKNADEQVEYSASLQQAKIKIKELQELEFEEGTCHVCNQSISSDLYDKLKTTHDKDIEFYSIKKKNAENRLEYLQISKKEIMQQIKDNDEIFKIKNEIKLQNSFLSSSEEEISKMEVEKDELFAKMVECKNKIQHHQEVLNSLKDDNFQNIHSELKKLKEERDNLNESVFKYGIQIGGLKQKIAGMQNKNDDLIILKKDHNKKLEELSIFDRLIKMFGKSGIQTLLLEAVISDLEKTSNEILSSISNDQFTISLETQRLGSDGVSLVETLDLNVKKDGSLYNFASLSGGEQFRIALALRIALSDVSTRHGGSSLEFLLLDEINSPLDKSGVETLFVNVIKSLESKYKILVITHDDSLKERFDNILDVSKINGESTVNFSTR